MDNNEQIEIVGNYGATLSFIEIGLGSLLHGLHLPFAGVFLSLNQGYLLARASMDSRSTHSLWVPYQISNVAAILKSFAPAGKKLGPMLSISFQGLLFNIGTLLLGVTLPGLSLGMILLTLWGFCQPLLTFYLFFGDDLFKAFNYMLERTIPYHGLSLENLLTFLLVVVFLKALLGVALVIFASRSQKAIEFQNKMMELGIKMRTKKMDDIPRSPAIQALRDLFRPLFLFSLLLTGMFLYFTEHDGAQIVWILLRPLGIGFLFFYFSRTLTLDKWLSKLETGHFRSFALSAKKALEKVRSVF